MTKREKRQLKRIVLSMLATLIIALSGALCIIVLEKVCVPEGYSFLLVWSVGLVFWFFKPAWCRNCLITPVLPPFEPGDHLKANDDHPRQAEVLFLCRVSGLAQSAPDKKLVVHKCEWAGGWRGGYVVFFVGTEEVMTPADWFVLEEDE